MTALQPHGAPLVLRRGYRTTSLVWTHVRRLTHDAQVDLPALLSAPSSGPGDIDVRFTRMAKPTEINVLLAVLLRAKRRLLSDHEIALLLEDGRRNRPLAGRLQPGIVRRPYALFLFHRHGLTLYLAATDNVGANWTYIDDQQEAVLDRVGKYTVLVPHAGIFRPRQPWMGNACRRAPKRKEPARHGPTQLPLPFS